MPGVAGFVSKWEFDGKEERRRLPVVSVPPFGRGLRLSCRLASATTAGSFINDEGWPPTYRSAGCSFQQCFDLCVEVLRNVERFLNSVGSKEGAHSVVREMYAVLALVDENSDGGIGSRIGRELDHLFHDERISNHHAQNRTCPCSLLFAQDLALVEAREFHEAGRSDSALNNLLQILGVFRRIDRLLKRFHIGMPDLCVDRCNDLPEWFRTGQAEPLNADLTCGHTLDLSNFFGSSRSGTGRCWCERQQSGPSLFEIRSVRA